MRTLTALAVVFVSAGCGSSNGAGDNRESPPRGGAEPPPRVLLSSAAGDQKAIQESSCVQSGGTSVCADTARLEPQQLTVVRQGDAVTFGLDRGEMRSGAGGPSASIRSFGCEGEVQRVALDPDSGRWRVELRPGTYSVDVFTRFSAGEAEGDTSGVVGLRVTTAGDRAILPARVPRAMSC